MCKKNLKTREISFKMKFMCFFFGFLYSIKIKTFLQLICFIFQIIQNNDKVYSYGECTTTGKNYLMKTFKVNNEPCHNETEWYYHVSKE